MKLRKKKETNMPFSVAVEMNAGSSKAQQPAQDPNNFLSKSPGKHPGFLGFQTAHGVGIFAYLRDFLIIST